MDADRKKFTFDNWYKKIYKIENNYTITLNDIFDFDEIHQYNGNNMICPRTIEDVEKNNSLFSKKKEKIKRLIECSESLKESGFYPFRLSGDADYELKLDKEKDKKMHYLLNFSLIPVTCNLNIVKGRRQLFDFLNNDLGDYYINKDIKNIPYRKWGRQYKDEKKNILKMDLEKKALKAYFDIFDSIEEYCKVVYLVEKTALSNLNAKEYWEERKKIIKDTIKEDLLCLDISEECYK